MARRHARSDPTRRPRRADGASPVRAADKPARPVDFNRDDPADPLEHVLPLPRPRRREAQGGHRRRCGSTPSRGCHRRPGRLRGDRPRQARRERADRADHVRRPDEVMPPPKHGKKLSAARDRAAHRLDPPGGPYAKHWSYVKPVRPALPGGQDAGLAQERRSTASSWPGSRREGLKPSPEADRYALIRRVVARPDRPAADARGGRRLRQRRPTRRLRKARRPPAGQAGLRRALGPAVARPGPLRRLGRLRRRPAAHDLGSFATTSSARSTPTSRSTSSRSSRSPATCCPIRPTTSSIATAFHRNTLTNNEGGHQRRGVPQRRRRRPREHDDGRLDGHDDRLRPVPRPQVRPALAGRVLPPLRLLQQHRGRRPQRRVAAACRSTATSRSGSGPTGKREIAALEKTLRTPTPELQAGQAALGAGVRARSRRGKSLEAGLGQVAGGREASRSATTASVRVEPRAKTDIVHRRVCRSTAGKLSAPAARSAARRRAARQGPGTRGGNFVVYAGRGRRSRRRERARPAGATSGSSCPARARCCRWPRCRSSAGPRTSPAAARPSRAAPTYDGPAQAGHRRQHQRRLHRGEVDHPHRRRRRPLVGSRPQVEQPVDRIVVWNRTDGDLQRPAERLPRRRARREAQAGLDADRRGAAATRAPSSRRRATQAVDVRRRLRRLRAAGLRRGQRARQQGPATKGWAVGGQTGQPHALTLVPASAGRGRAGLDADRHDRAARQIRRAHARPVPARRPPTTTARSSAPGRRRRCSAILQDPARAPHRRRSRPSSTRHYLAESPPS